MASRADELESRARALGGSLMATLELKEQVEEAMREAERSMASSELISRLDSLMIYLAELARENVCTNIKCPHYNKKCRMR
jgi:hypothetical protein